MSESYIILSMIAVDFLKNEPKLFTSFEEERSGHNNCVLRADDKNTNERKMIHYKFVYFSLCFNMLRDTIILLCGIRRSSMDNERDKVISGRSMNACTEGGSHR